MIKEALIKALPKSILHDAKFYVSEFQYYYSSLQNRKWISDALHIAKRKPLKLGIETSNICNANCTFCAYQYQIRKKSIMSNEVFQKIIDDYCNMGGGVIELTPVVGEILVDKNIYDKIAYAHSKEKITDIIFYTNGIALSPEVTDRLLTSGIKKISISTSGFSKEMYQRVYRSNKYEQVFENILYLLKTNEEQGKPIDIELYIRGDKAHSEIRESVDYKQIAQYTCNIVFTHYYDDWGGVIRQNDLSGNMILSSPMKKKGTCYLLTYYPKVLVNGDVSACGCRDYNGSKELYLGNIQKNSLSEIWNNGLLDQLFKRFENEDYPETCKNCNQYRSFRHFATTSWGKRVLRESQELCR